MKRLYSLGCAFQILGLIAVFLIFFTPYPSKLAFAISNYLNPNIDAPDNWAVPGYYLMQAVVGSIGMVVLGFFVCVLCVRHDQE